MANISKMSATNAPEAAPGHVASPFFKVLPPEIRLNIYKKAFQGARVHAMLAMETEPSGGGGKKHPVRFHHSKHFNLLLRCRKIYHEALPTYWSEAVLNLVQLDMDGDSPELSRHWMGDHHYKGDEYSHFLCNSLPEVVKTNVKHVRGMMLAPLHGRFVKKNPYLTPTAMLSGFKSLATCEISSTMLCHPEVRMIETDIRPRFSFRHDFEVNNESNTERIAENHPTDPLARKCGRFKTSWEQVGYEPKALVRRICGIDATGKVVFLVKVEVVVVTVEFEVGAEVPGQATFNIMPPQRVLTVPPSIPTRTNTMKQIWNLSTGIFCEVDPKEVTDEEGFDMVVQGDRPLRGRAVRLPVVEDYE